MKESSTFVAYNRYSTLYPLFVQRISLRGYKYFYHFYAPLTYVLFCYEYLSLPLGTYFLHRIGGLNRMYFSHIA